MGFEELASELQKSAESEGRKLIHAAERNAAKAEQAAQEKADEGLRLARKEVAAAIKQESAERATSAKLSAKKIVDEARDEAVEASLHDVWKEFKSSSLKKSVYPALFARLVEEGLKELGAGDAVLYVRDEDRPFVSGYRAAKLPSQYSGGAIVESANGKIRVNKTLEEAFAQGKSALRPRLDAPGVGGEKMSVYAGPVGWLKARLTFKPLVYGYSNARVRAMRTALLSRRQAEDLLKVRTNAAVAEYLGRTGYREDFTGMPAGINDEDRVELAVSRNFARTAQKIIAITPEQGRGTLRAFLGRYDVHNLKAILLSRKLGKGSGETRRMLVPAGSLSSQELERMLSSKSADELYEAIRASGFGARFFASASIRHIPKAQIRAVLQQPDSNSAKLDMLLSALDSYYYEVASAAANGGQADAGILLKLIRSEADAKNAITIMRMKKGGADKRAIMKSMVAGGNFTHRQLENMAEAKGFREVANLASGFFISETGRGEFAAAEKKYNEDGQLSHFEVVFEGSIARRSLKVLRRSMMSIGAIAGFLFLKEEEMNNIRKIVRGKALGLSPEKVAEMLIFVG